ncbi:hypothetical protein CYMTET_16757 [Cymbomonas tetramitiformis]|uniref:Uncharacterized protein n=1 Tax=Cymbomonas tetramitiformis TaxID=36881 RepID=A0AAE0GBC1_9CHLO|nr:hypothetical protein CYMTET_16757 [Cymbomonas tetramitiformis]
MALRQNTTLSNADEGLTRTTNQVDVNGPSGNSCSRHGTAPTLLSGFAPASLRPLQTSFPAENYLDKNSSVSPMPSSVADKDLLWLQLYSHLQERLSEAHREILYLRASLQSSVVSPQTRNLEPMRHDKPQGSLAKPRPQVKNMRSKVHSGAKGMSAVQPESPQDTHQCAATLPHTSDDAMLQRPAKRSKPGPKSKDPQGGGVWAALDKFISSTDDGASRTTQQLQPMGLRVNPASNHPITQDPQGVFQEDSGPQRLMLIGGSVQQDLQPQSYVSLLAEASPPKLAPRSPEIKQVLYPQEILQAEQQEAPSEDLRAEHGGGTNEETVAGQSCEQPNREYDGNNRDLAPGDGWEHHPPQSPASGNGLQESTPPTKIHLNSYPDASPGDMSNSLQSMMQETGMACHTLQDTLCPEFPMLRGDVAFTKQQ